MFVVIMFYPAVGARLNMGVDPGELEGSPNVGDAYFDAPPPKCLLVICARYFDMISMVIKMWRLQSIANLQVVVSAWLNSLLSFFPISTLLTFRACLFFYHDYTCLFLHVSGAINYLSWWINVNNNIWVFQPNLRHIRASIIFSSWAMRRIDACRLWKSVSWITPLNLLCYFQLFSATRCHET